MPKTKLPTYKKKLTPSQAGKKGAMAVKLRKILRGKKRDDL